MIELHINISYLCVIKTLFDRVMLMKTNDIFNLLHNAVESKFFGKKISQREMADRLGVSMRTYQDWRIGNSQPQAVTVILKMLGELEGDDVVRLIKRISNELRE